VAFDLSSCSHKMLQAEGLTGVTRCHTASTFLDAMWSDMQKPTRLSERFRQRLYPSWKESDRGPRSLHGKASQQLAMTRLRLPLHFSREIHHGQSADVLYISESDSLAGCVHHLHIPDFRGQTTLPNGQLRRRRAPWDPERQRCGIHAHNP
jgi:hypothetical protein